MGQGLQAVSFLMSVCGATLGTIFLEENPLALMFVYIACMAVEMVSTEIFMFSPTTWVQAKGFAWPNLGHASTRTGIAVMISLGEAVLQILIADFPVESFVLHVRFGLMAFLICYCVAMQYFDAQPDTQQYRRMRLKHKRRDVIVRILQPVLLFSVFLVGVGFKLLLSACLEEASEGSKNSAHHRLLGHAATEPATTSGHAAHALAQGVDTHASTDAVSTRWWESISDACVVLAVAMCVCQILLVYCRILRDGFGSSVETRTARAKLCVRILLALAHGAVGCVTFLSDFLEGFDHGIGSLEVHLLLICPELLMHFAGRKQDCGDSSDEDDDVILNPDWPDTSVAHV